MADNIVVTQHSQFSTKHSNQFRAIYLDSFPSHERAEFSYLVDSIAQGTRWFFAATRDNDLLGFAVVVPHVASDIHLLEYLAVGANARNQGVGSFLLASVIAAIRTSQSVTGLLIEVEPDDEGNDAERKLRARRIDFYRRHGAQVVTDTPNYRVPLADRTGTMRMKLLWLPLTENVEMPRGEQLRECVMGVLDKSYGMTDEQIDCMANGID